MGGGEEGRGLGLGPRGRRRRGTCRNTLSPAGLATTCSVCVQRDEVKHFPNTKLIAKYLRTHSN